MNKLKEWIEEHNINQQEQFGFWKGCKCIKIDAINSYL